MKVNSLLTSTVIVGVPLVASHATVWNILVNGVDKGVGNGQGRYIDSPPNNSPITDVYSSVMECNVPSVKAQTSVTVSGGDEIAFEWHHNDNSAGDDIIADSHHGPILVYISKATTPGLWTKIWEDGFDPNTNLWAVDKLIAGSYTGKKGQHKVKLPNLAPGDYVLRPEIIALHEAQNYKGAQFYMECVHIKVTGSGTVSLPLGVSFPGAYSPNDPGIYVFIYPVKPPYIIPGPAVWVAGASTPLPSSAANNPAPSSSPVNAPSSAAISITLATVLSTPALPSPSPSKAPATGCTNTGGSVKQYDQCGGRNYQGARDCIWPYICQYVNDYYSQCLSDPNFNSAACGGGTVARYGQCGGQNYGGDTKCQYPYTCRYSNPYYSQCL